MDPCSSSTPGPKSPARASRRSCGRAPTDPTRWARAGRTERTQRRAEQQARLRRLGARAASCHDPAGMADDLVRALDRTRAAVVLSIAVLAIPIAFALIV